ncbi:hypothetical protein B0T13DRAFT_396413, partial [Neurospora crassa]
QQLLLQVNSKGGTRKSYFIQLLSYKLIDITNNLPKPIIITIPINITANNINSYIIYSLLKLLFKIMTLNNFDSIRLSNIQREFREYKYFIINEKSILGIRNIYFINKRP